MKQKDTVELAKARALKAARTAINLKFRLLADEAINEYLPKIEAEFDRAVAAQQPYELDIASVFEEQK